MSNSTVIQVLMTEALIPAFERWLASRELNLYRLPEFLQDEGTDAIPLYGIGLNDALWKLTQEVIQ